MRARDRSLEQEKPKGETPAKINQRQTGGANEDKKQGKTGKLKLPTGKIAQHKAKPGMTTPQ